MTRMQLYSVYIILICFVLYNTLEIAFTALFSKYKLLDKDTNSLCADYHIEWEISVPSVTACVFMSSKHPLCIGLVYKKDGEVCYGLQSGNEAVPCATKLTGGVIYWKLPDTCPSGWERLSEWCYHLINTEEVWQRASEICKSFSEVSHLAYVHTNEEHTAIKTWFQSMGKSDRAWLGGYRINNTVNWIWEDGVEITESDDFVWGGGEPDNEYPTDCLLFYSARVDFGDRSCTSDYTVLCEIDIYN